MMESAMLAGTVTVLCALPVLIWIGVRHRNRRCDLCASRRYVRKLRNGGRLCAGCRESLEGL